MSKNDGGLAFAGKRLEPMWPGDPLSQSEVTYPGMTLRDYFAAQYLASSHSEGAWDMGAIAAEAYRMADAMIAARSK